MVQVAKVCRMVRLKYSLNSQKPPIIRISMALPRAIKFESSLPEIHINELHQRVANSPLTFDFLLLFAQLLYVISAELQHAVDESSIQIRVFKASIFEAIIEISVASWHAAQRASRNLLK